MENSQSSMDSTIIWSSFAFIWGSLLWVVSITELTGGIDFFAAGGKKMSAVAPAPVVADAESMTIYEAKKALKDYMFSFFPNMFSDKPDNAKFWCEFAHSHRYMALLSDEHRVKSRCARALEIITVLTVEMFFIALLFDAEWPGHNNYCNSWSSAGSCLSRKRMFDPDKAVCSWEVDSGNCVWISPSYSLLMQSAILVVVVAFSGPVTSIIGFVVHDIVMSPTKVQLNEQESMLKLPKDHVTVVGVSEKLTPAQRKKVKCSECLVPIKNVLVVHNSLLKYCLDRRSMRQFVTNLWECSSNRLEKFSSEKVNSEKATGADTILRELRRLQVLLKGIEKVKFECQWKDMLAGTSISQKSKDLLATEVSDVEVEAAAIIESLRLLPSVMVGARIFELFVLDLLGRRSNAAKLFVSYRQAIGCKYITTSWIKVLALFCIIGVDVYLMIMCRQLGGMKGRKWQLNWVICCVAYLFVDIFVKHINLAWILSYFVPSLIHEHVTEMKIRLAWAVDNFSNHMINLPSNSDSGPPSAVVADRRYSVAQGISAFSVTDSLFVSVVVARAYPNLLESGIVLSYRSLTVSDYQARALKYRPGIPVANLLKDESHFGSTTADQTGVTDWMAKVAWSLTVRNLLWLGRSNKSLQLLVVQLMDPIIIGTSALIGICIVRLSLIGAPIVVTAVAIIAYLGYYRYQNKVLKQKRVAIHKVSPIRLFPQSSSSSIKSSALNTSGIKLEENSRKADSTRISELTTLKNKTNRFNDVMQGVDEDDSSDRKVDNEAIEDFNGDKMRNTEYAGSSDFQWKEASEQGAQPRAASGSWRAGDSGIA
jgi:hypothetical protein